MPRAKRIRITLAEGVYQDAHGISVIARLGSGKALISAPPVRFPLVDSDGIPYSKQNNVELVRCRLQLLEDLKTKRARRGGEAGSLGAAIDAWIVAHPLTPRADGKVLIDDTRADLHRLLAHWRSSPIAAAPVAELKRSQVRAQLKAWTDVGRAPTTVNHRMRALAMVLRETLGADDDDDLILPTDGISYLPPPKGEPRGILMPILARILATMPDRGRGEKGGPRPDYSETKIRLRVMSWTGLAHKSLQRLERKRVNFREGKLFLPARKKGKGAEGAWVDLLPPAIEALRDYDRAALWGKTFSRASMRKSWRRAVVNCRKGLVLAAEQSGDQTMLEQFDATVPPNCNPYDTRHSFLSDAYRQSGDIHAVKHLAQHADIKTTERYTKAAVPDRVASAIDKMRARWFPESPKPGATVRAFHVVEKS
jgi:integrase